MVYIQGAVEGVGQDVALLVRHGDALGLAVLVAAEVLAAYRDPRAALHRP